MLTLRITNDSKEHSIDTHIDSEEIEIRPIYKNPKEENSKLKRIDVAYMNIKGKWEHREFTPEIGLSMFMMNSAGKTVSRYNISENGKWGA